GIRDLIVTGVQTCALPISLRIRIRYLQPVEDLLGAEILSLSCRRTWRGCLSCWFLGRRLCRCCLPYCHWRRCPSILWVPSIPWRSEERRVGKGCIYWVCGG